MGVSPSLTEIVALDAPLAAPLLLNKLLINGDCAGRIDEVEAYMPDDPASHSFCGMTGRNASMFGPPGVLYVYFIYGMYHCANVVTGPIGSGQAVLIRAVEPTAGIELMRHRRGRTPLADGPGKLCQAFAIERTADGVDLLAGGTLRLVDDGTPPPDDPHVGVRIGLTNGVDTPWRWSISATR